MKVKAELQATSDATEGQGVRLAVICSTLELRSLAARLNALADGKDGERSIVRELAIGSIAFFKEDPPLVKLAGGIPGKVQR